MFSHVAGWRRFFRILPLLSGDQPEKSKMAKSRKQLCEERAEVIAKARKINDDHTAEDGTLPAEHQQQYDDAMKVAAGLGDEIKRFDQLQDAETELAQRLDRGEDIPGPSNVGNDGAAEKGVVKVRQGWDADGAPQYVDMKVGPRGSKSYQEAFGSYLGGRPLSSEQYAALQSDDAQQAGYLNVPEQFASGLLKAVDDQVLIRRMARIHTVPNADSLGIRKRTAKLDSFDWSEELSVSTEDSTLAFGLKSLTPHHLTGQIKVSRDLLRRSLMGVEPIVREELSRDGGEVMEQAYLTGDGAQKPLGVFTASSDGISTARDVLTGSSSNFTADQLVAAKYTLKQQYRNGGDRAGARWMFHRDGISKIAQLKDADNHYLLHPGRGLTGDEYDTLLGYPVDESEFAPNTFTTGLYVGILANWRYYEIADALNIEIQRLVELDAATNQVRFLARLKTDGLPTLEEAFVRLKTS